MGKAAKQIRYPDAVTEAMVDRLAHKAVAKMTPRDLGLMLYPGSTPISLSRVPTDVVADHRNRYTQKDLETGQFLEVLAGKYIFIMAHETKRQKSGEENPEKPSRGDAEGREPRP